MRPRSLSVVVPSQGSRQPLCVGLVPGPIRSSGVIGVNPREQSSTLIFATASVACFDLSSNPGPPCTAALTSPGLSFGTTLSPIASSAWAVSMVRVAECRERILSDYTTFLAAWFQNVRQTHVDSCFMPSSAQFSRSGPTLVGSSTEWALPSVRIVTLFESCC